MILRRLTPEEQAALERVRDELWPGYSLEAAAVRLIRDSLVQMGLMPLPKGNRSGGAIRGAPKARS